MKIQYNCIMFAGMKKRVFQRIAVNTPCLLCFALISIMLVVVLFYLIALLTTLILPLQSNLSFF